MLEATKRTLGKFVEGLDKENISPAQQEKLDGVINTLSAVSH